MSRHSVLLDGLTIALMTIVVLQASTSGASPSIRASSAAVPSLQANIQSSDDFAVFTNATVQLPGIAQKSLVMEPSVAQKNQIIFYIGNWFAARSSDAGLNWAYVDPKSGFNVSDPFCCDQDTIYIPSRGIFVWYRMGVNASSYNEFLLSVSTNASFWWNYSFRPTDVDPLWTNQFFDFVILAYSNSYLYVTNNLFKTPCSIDCYANSLILRLSLDTLKNDKPLFPISSSDYYATQNEGFAPVQGATKMMYFASHSTTDPTGTLLLYVWNESMPSSTILTVPIKHTAYTPTGDGGGLTLPSCPTPDGGNICLRLDDRILGGWISNGVIGFFWSVAQGSGFAEPYTYIIRINATLMTNMDFKHEPILANPNYAWVYAWISPNARGDLGLVAYTAGLTRYPTLDFGIQDTISNHTWQFYPGGVASSTHGPGVNGIGKSCLSDAGYACWGDFIRVRAYNGTGNAWIATGYSLLGPCSQTHTSQCNSLEARYLVLGRIGDDPFNYANVTLTFHSNLPSTGTISCAGQTFLDGQMALLPANTTIPCTANPPSGYHLKSWSGLATGTSIAINVFTHNGGSLTADFAVGVASTLTPTDTLMMGLMLVFVLWGGRRFRRTRFSSYPSTQLRTK